ncbi:DUF5682 family protein [Umezawaea endophytica]|uniref:DUF5682 family protein n=1 Tax=Umezawaea endophytica TaxID=1654476 RepID=A0A9X2VTA2_9PSEU|nr:DUF5682 family protein [Umezawaea endophytica]MCS7481932.1 DUF5682 family protein [Umezawaea endophytica]
MATTFIGVRHHSPACAGLVAATIEELRPAYVLVEGPVDMNGRLDELLLGHELPVAVYTYYRDGERSHASWTPFCDYSPEWVALTAGRASGAEVRFIDLPAWHPAFAGRGNRYADAEARYTEVTDRLCREFAVDNVDVLWDHLFEVEPADGLAERLTAYFDVLRGEASTEHADVEREAYMAAWIRAAQADAGDRPVVVVTGGFHTPALRAMTAGPAAGWEWAGTAARAGQDWTGAAAAAGQELAEAPLPLGQERTETPPQPGQERAEASPPVGQGWAETPPRSGQEWAGTSPPVEQGWAGASAGREWVGAGWPAVPEPPVEAVGASYLVPYSFRRLDAFTGYQSGMPSPEYYQRLWTDGVAGAAAGLVESVVGRLRRRKQAVSTADLIAARTLAEGLARLRGHGHPSRTDVLDGLVGALVSEDLSQPTPWTVRGPLRAGAHPAVVEMVAALSGERVGRLHPETPSPPLVEAVRAELFALDLDGSGEVRVDLTDSLGLRRSRVLHRLRVLEVVGFHRLSGPSGGGDPVYTERWLLTPSDRRLPALIEAAAYGATPDEAAAGVLRERVPDAGVDELAGVLFDAALCGITAVSGSVVASLRSRVARVADVGALGRVLATVVGLWRYDGLFGTAGSPVLAAVIDGAVTRLLWLVEGLHGGAGPADPRRLLAVAAARDAVLHAEPVLENGRDAAVAVLRRVAADPQGPPDLRGAAFGFCWSLGDGGDVERAVRGMSGPRTIGDWLAGLFAVAREEVLSAEAVVELLDELVHALSEEDFLIALPALRQAFAYFPPSERETIAERVMIARGVRGSVGPLLRADVDPAVVAAGMALEAKVDAVLAREGLA